MSFGTHAQYLIVPKNSAYAIKPKHLSHQEAVSFLFGFTTAQYFLDKTKPLPGQKILIYGVSGAVGIAALQISKIYNLDITTVTSKRNILLMHDLGANQTLDYTQSDFKLPTNEYNIIFDCVGKLDKKIMKQAFKPSGQFITVGGLDVSKETKEQIENISTWSSEGLITPIIDKIFDFKDIVDAHDYVEQGHKVGSVIINIQ